MKHWLLAATSALALSGLASAQPKPAAPAPPTPAAAPATPAAPAGPKVELPFQANVPAGFTVEKTAGPDGQGIFFRKGAGYVHVFLPNTTPDALTQKAEAENFALLNGWKTAEGKAPAKAFSAQQLDFDAANRSGIIYLGTIEGKPARVTLSTPKAKPPSKVGDDAQPLLDSLVK